MSRCLLAVLTGLVAVASTACHAVNLSQALEVTDLSSGYFDAGIVDGKIHLVPEVTFKLHNRGTESVSAVQLMANFIAEGQDAEADSVQITGVGMHALEPGASSEPLVIRSRVGFTLEGAITDFFTNPEYRDFSAKVFAQHGGEWYALGTFKISRAVVR